MCEKENNREIVRFFSLLYIYIYIYLDKSEGSLLVLFLWERY